MRTKTLVAAALGLFCLLAAGHASAQSTRRGDVNGDGRVNVADAVAVLQYLAGLKTPTAQQSAAADVDGDGKLRVSDAVLLLKAVAGLATLPGGAEPPTTEPAVDLAASTIYPSGTRVRASWAGLSFVVPTDWAGGLDTSLGSFVMASTAHPGMVALVTAQATAPNPISTALLAQVASQPVQVDKGVTLQPQGQAQVSGLQVTQSYLAQGTYVPVTGLAIAQVGATGTSGGILIAGPQDQQAYMQGVAQAFVSSLRFSTPDTGKWWSAMGGYWYKTTSGTYTPPSGGGGSVSTDGQSVYYLCASGTFEYDYHGYVSTSAGLAEISDHKEGSWGISIDLFGPTLLMVPKDGSQVMSFRIAANASTVYFGETAVERGVNQRCGG
ncbi:MAG TPA: dockerin type I repeat-containing protein [Armatimonadota bacterium]|jgi:hypothetical protein